MDFPYKKKFYDLVKILKITYTPSPSFKKKKKNPEYDVNMQICVISKSLSTSQETSPALQCGKTCKAIVPSHYFGKC